jgi:hypothetical protein
MTGNRKRLLLAAALLCPCLLLGCAREAPPPEKRDVSPYFDDTRAVLQELSALIGGSAADADARLAAGRDASREGFYYVTVFGQKETAVVRCAGATDTVSDFRVSLAGPGETYVDYDEAMAAMLGAPVSSDQTPYEGDNGVTRWDSYALDDAEIRLCRDKNGAWLAVLAPEPGGETTWEEGSDRK